ncbi:MAG: tripartite tricarboxylate transporter TctB family protein [Burkholderiaceae bacterium]|nr:tripartite tricarboxylate transporter TctB family protein [Burkholderiaceae bacterium]
MAKRGLARKIIRCLMSPRPDVRHADKEAFVRIRNEKDFWSGVMFVAFGLGFAGFAQQYDMGTAQRMGPAFFPTILGGLLAVIGVIVGLKGLAAETMDGKLERFHLGPIFWVLGAVVAFGLLLRPAGLMVALVALIGISSLGSHEFKALDTVLLAIGLCLLVLAVFIYGLGLTIPVWPVFMRD